MLIKWNVTIPKLSGDAPRRCFVWLPEGYGEDAEKRYPVLYMFDGHNVFRDEDATFGKSWGMEEYLDRTGRELIVVAVECNHQGSQRLSEYSPYSYRNRDHGSIPGKGPTYMKWLVHQLKPHVDKTFRTLPDRDHTAIAGSSMGGLMALYAVTVYNHVFRQAACLSPSLWVVPVQMASLLARSAYAQDTMVYLSCGQNEGMNRGANRLVLSAAAQQLFAKGVNLTFRITRNGEHCEADWEKEVPIFMDSLEL